MASRPAPGASATGTSSTRIRRPRLPSSGSFHAGDIIPNIHHYRPSRKSVVGLRRQSTMRYTTFPTQPPKTPCDTPNTGLDHASQASFDHGGDQTHDDEHETTPLPVKQLMLLALLSLCEQTALNSISPYLPTMVASFDEIPPGQVGLFVGMLASAFALAQLTTNLMWGYMSDVVGRKPIMLLGTGLLAVCFVFFGFCTRYWQLLVVHIAMGLLNGNAAVVPTCLGEVTDRTNQSRAFTWLPVMYSIGGITGPAVGGLLVAQTGTTAYPFFAPNIASALVLGIAVVVLGIWFRDTLDEGEKRSAAEAFSWVTEWCSCCCGGRKLRRGDSADNDDDDGISREDQALLHDDNCYDGSPGLDDPDMSTEKSFLRQLLQRNTILVLLTYLVFQLANISFNSLYPIFASAPPPTGRKLFPETIGLLLSSSGIATIIFQIFLFQPIKTRLGNLRTYQITLLGIAITMTLMPWVGYLDDQPSLGIGSGKRWLYVELAAVLVIKNICAIGGLSSVLLLITNCAPSNESLGTLNGIAQTLSAAGRSIGPFLSGGLFTLATRIEPKGEALAWGLFGGIALAGWVGSLAIRRAGLESADWTGGSDDEDSDQERGDEERQQR